MKKLILASAALISVSGGASAKCISPHEYVPFIGEAARPGGNGQVALGMYSRISPDGRFVLRSFSGDHLSTVTLMELAKQTNGTKVAKAYETDLKNESFPVQGSWRFIVDVDGSSHYRVGDIVNRQKDAKRQFRGGISGFYATSAEMPGSTNEKIVLRSLSWPNDSNGTEGMGTGQLKNMLVTVKKNSDGSYDKTDSEGAFTMCNNLRTSDGWLYSLPMISADGTEFSAMPQKPADRKSSMRIYRFGANNKDCEKVDDLNVPASKAIFGFAQPGKKAPLVFYSNSVVGNRPVTGIHLYDRDLKKTFFVGDTTKWVAPDAFPGMTKDGRIIYGAKWKDCETCAEKTGYVITDFYQSEDFKRFRQQSPGQAKNMKQCVTEEEVAKVESEQAAIYGLSPMK